MRDLIEEVFTSLFQPPGMEDQARLASAALAAPGARLALTTDSFVVTPLEFPGGDIGKLAICGTVNDLAVGGAEPLWLSAAFIIEEGTEIALLRRIAATMADEARAAGVRIVTGDTKVVERGAADGLFITTTGVGVIPPGRELSAAAIRPGDRLLVNGGLGDHGATILAARGDLALSTDLQSDCAALGHLMAAVLKAAPGARAARDATRGGVAAVLNEMAEASGVGLVIEEEALPLRAEVVGLCEILGLDPAPPRRRSVGTPARDFRSRSERRWIAPGGSPSRGASAAASTVLPLPETPPMAKSRAGGGESARSASSSRPRASASL
nr:hydrogenase expression/formation protein HypE [Cereibacter sphaeroides]